MGPVLDDDDVGFQNGKLPRASACLHPAMALRQVYTSPVKWTIRDVRDVWVEAPRSVIYRRRCLLFTRTVGSGTRQDRDGAEAVGQ